MRATGIQTPGEWITKFNDHVTSTEESYPRLADYRRHCTHWVKLELEKKLSNVDYKITKVSKEKISGRDFIIADAEDEDGKLMFPEYDCYIDNFSSDIFHATTKYKNEIFNILFSGEIDKYLWGLNDWIN